MKTPLARIFTIFLVAIFAITSSGCSTFLGRRTQTVRVITIPPGKNVYYEGRIVSDGERVTIRKHFQAPKFNVGTQNRPRLQEMQYDPDPGLVGDAAWLLAGGIPGIIAFGVDGATGAWREILDPQHVYISD